MHETPPILPGAINMVEQTITHLLEITRDTLSDVTESVNGYGITTRRADVKDLTFPGILQEIMNRVLAAVRQSQAELVEARTRAEVEQIESESRAEVTRRDAQTEAESQGTSQDAGEPPGTAATCRTRNAGRTRARRHLGLDRFSLNGTDSGKHNS